MELHIGQWASGPEFWVPNWDPPHRKNGASSTLRRSGGTVQQDNPATSILGHEHQVG